MAHLMFYFTKKDSFSKVVRTSYEKTIFGPLQKVPLTMVRRGHFFLPHIMRGAFSALSLFYSSLWLRLGLVFVLDTLQAFVCLASCGRLLFKMSVFFYVSLHMLNDSFSQRYTPLSSGVASNHVF